MGPTAKSGKMLIIGLLGGIGSGKSTVADMFRELGAVNIDADRIGHQILLQADVKASARQRWGEDVFDARGELDRRKLAGRVFADPDDRTAGGARELQFLKSLTHPLIGKEIERQVREFQELDKPLVVFDAPLLLEANWDPIVDQTVFVDAPRPIRLARVLHRGWTESEFDAREAAQLGVEEKRLRADWIVDNAGSLDATLDQVREIWQNFSNREFRR